jgi:hypothetical protein
MCAELAVVGWADTVLQAELMDVDGELPAACNRCAGVTEVLTRPGCCAGFYVHTVLQAELMDVGRRADSMRPLCWLHGSAD